MSIQVCFNMTNNAILRKIIVIAGKRSAPKALNNPSRGFQTISDFLLSFAKFVMTNKVICVRNLSAILEELFCTENIKIFIRDFF